MSNAGHINAGHINFNWTRYINLAEELLNSMPFGKNNKSYAFVAEELKRLKLMRIKADYKDKYFENENINASLKKELEKAILRAKSTIKKIDEIETMEKY